MYFITLHGGTGALDRLEMTPFQIRNFRLNRASSEDARWLRDVLDREARGFDLGIELTTDNRLRLLWS